MSKLKFNNNYIRNAKKPEKIQEIVESMIAEKVNSKPFDFLFRRNSESYTKTTHEVLGLPGIFKQMETPNVFTINGKSLQQDLVESVLPDGKIIMQESTLNVEQQAYIITPAKVEHLYFYKIFNIGKHEKPCIPVIVTNIDYKTDEILYKINGEFFTIRIIYFSKEKIDIILNTLSEKDYSKEEMSEADFINLVHCIIFATKEHAKEVIEKIVKIFVSCEKIQDKHQMDLFLALKIMIKYRYDDEKEIRRLLTMITQSVSEKQLEQVLGYEELIQKNKDSEIKLAEKDRIIAEIKEENKKLRNKIKKNK
ncbi:hypothetical protein [uncultured Methanobrevibacter sp.]|uniref:hypothetical protein n=1 Tax=uncultured Methanobrevibacter sp. TaxID=253161 RepID=UPI00262F378F|nr:hypothetical protein [uncultured Methanobrevibacter sp.]